MELRPEHIRISWKVSVMQASHCWSRFRVRSATHHSQSRRQTPDVLCAEPPSIRVGSPSAYWRFPLRHLLHHFHHLWKYMNCIFRCLTTNASVSQGETVNSVPLLSISNNCLFDLFQLVKTFKTKMIFSESKL